MKIKLTNTQKDQLKDLINETILPAIQEDVLGSYEVEDEEELEYLLHEALQFVKDHL